LTSGFTGSPTAFRVVDPTPGFTSISVSLTQSHSHLQLLYL
jgi:hypothetical protein